MSKKLLFLACIAVLAVALAGCDIKGPNIYQISFNAVASAKPDAAIDTNGNLHAVYERNGNIYYKKNRGAEQLVAAGTDASIAVGSNNIPQVVYLDSGNVKFTKLDGAWTAPETLGAGDWATIDVDSLNNAHAAFSALDADGYSDIIYANNASGDFISALVLNGKSDVVNDLDDEGNPYAYTVNYSYFKPVIKLDSNDNYYIAHLKTSDYGIEGIEEDIEVKSDLAGADFTSGAGGGLDISKNAFVLDSSGNALIVAGDKTSSSITRVMIDYANTNGGISTVGTVYSDEPLDNPTGAVIVANEANEEVVAVDLTSGVKFFGKSADGWFNLIDSGNEFIDSLNPVMILGAGSHYVYYEKSGNIYLATDQTIADTNPPVVSGVAESGLYNTAKTITFSDDEAVATATLNGTAFASGDAVSADGTHVLIVTDGANPMTVNFTIDTAAPVVSGVADGTTYTSAIASITFADGAGSGINAATLNGGAFASGAGVSTNGSYTLIVSDNAGNATTIAFTVAIPAPVTPPATGGGGGGGGGGGSATTYCGSIVYGDWQSACLNGVQFRNVLTRIPSGCALTVAQQLEQSRSCSATATTTPQITPTPQVLGVTYCGDFKNGDLIRNLVAAKIYALINNQKYHIASLAELRAKYAGKKINNVSAEVIACYPNYTGQVLGVEYNGKFSDGTLIRNKVSLRIYVIKDGKKLHIISLEELRAHYAGKKINNLTPAEVDLYPNY